MFTRFETTKSTKGASKLRRDLINAEIANLRDLLPLPPSTRQRLSQLQLMALVCVYVRKANYFQQMFKRYDISQQVPPCSNFGFSKALTGFLMMMTQNGKLLYISDNAAEYLGHSMEDLLIHGDSVYDIIDKQDQQSVRNELTKSPIDDEHRIFLCRMNVARNARRQMRFGDQKVVLIRGHFVSYLPLCSRNEPVFLASCTPLAMPETRECIVHGATNVFTTIHTMDMKILHVDTNSEWHLGWERNSLQGISWYQLLHPDCSRDAQTKHRLITQSEQERSCIALLRIQTRSGQFLWTHSVLQVKENTETSQQPVIVCTNQILSNEEALVMKANPWLYHFYSVQSKLHYGLAYDTNNRLYNNISERNPDTQYASAPCINGNQGVVHGNYQTLTAPVMGSYHTSFSYECERRDIGPVDYSVHLNNERYQHLKYYEHRTPSQPTVKRKHKLEESKSITPLGNTSPNTSPSIPNIGGDGPLIASTPTIILPTRRPTLKNICQSEYSSEQNDHWNPSPPWSESPLQKVPDVCQQDLGPYMTTTPPTPSGTPKTYGQNNYSHTFIFEWSPEQYVPHKSATKCHMYTSIENNDSWSRDQRCSFVASSKENEKTQIGEIKAENKMCCDNDNEQHIESPPLNGDLTQNSPDSKKLVL